MGAPRNDQCCPAEHRGELKYGRRRRDEYEAAGGAAAKEALEGRQDATKEPFQGVFYRHRVD